MQEVRKKSLESQPVRFFVVAQRLARIFAYTKGARPTSEKRMRKRKKKKKRRSRRRMTKKKKKKKLRRCHDGETK